MGTSAPANRPATRTSPFAEVRWGVAAAVLYLVLAAAAVTVELGLPTGRWFALHLFTLGTLTNLVLVFSRHFGETLTRSRSSDTTVLVAALNAGVVVTLTGMTTGSTLGVAIGGSGVTLVVFHAYWRLRALRRGALGARFGWIVRIYERAHGAFVHGAVLGVLLGTGVLTGPWYWSGRLAHLHVNVLGWAGLTLLATIVFFGPTMLRRQIEPGADEVAARALRRGAGGLTVAVLMLLATGLPGATGSGARLLAGLGLGFFAWAATTVCGPVARVARSSEVTVARIPVTAACVWFPLVTWADVVVVATGSWRHLDVLGAVLLLGVLVQTIAAALTYVAPLLVRTTAARREQLRERLSIWALPRAIAFNVGVVLLALAVMPAAPDVGALTAVAWTLLVAPLALPAVAMAVGSRRDD